MADDTDQVNPSDGQLMQRQFAIVFEQLINLAQFELPFVLVLLDDTDNVIGTKSSRRATTQTSWRLSISWPPQV